MMFVNLWGCKMSIDHGFFTAEQSKEVEKMKSVLEVQIYLQARVEDHVERHPKTKRENVTKILREIDRAKSINSLLTLMWGHIMAHPSEGQKVIR